MAVVESSSGRAGSSAVVDRLAEVLLIQVLRAWSDMAPHPDSFLEALRDEALARAIALVHQHPSRPIGLADLAHAAGLGRSAFASRFHERVGLTPMAYVTEWRMRLARELLLGSEASMAEIAERVGYESEWAFAKAFKRVWGESPGRMRRACRSA